MSRVEEPESFTVEFCLDCTYKHLTAVQDHLEDGVALSKTSEEREFIAGILGQVRDARKKVLDKLREMPTNPSPEEAKALSAAIEELKSNMPGGVGFHIEKVKPKEYFDPSSFRTLCPECPGQRCSECPPELRETATRVIIGCKKGEFEGGKCQIGTEAHVVFHGPKG